MLRHAMTSRSAIPRYIEIAVNLGDPMFQGEYHGKKKHEGMHKKLMQSISSMSFIVRNKLASRRRSLRPAP